jgi:hypothetical protein
MSADEIRVSYEPKLRDVLHAARIVEGERFFETPRAFVLSYGRGVPTVIPKAAFVDDAGVQAARALLAEVVGARPR